MALHVAEAFVGVGVDFAKLDADLMRMRRRVELAIDRASRQAINPTIRVNPNMGGMGAGFMRNVQQGIGQGFGQGLYNTATRTIGGIIDVVRNLGNALVKSNAEFEQYELALSVLLGGGEKGAQRAKQRMRELEQYAIHTSFELPEVVRANRILETYGGSVLSTGKNFKLIGDMATVAQRPLEEVAFWIGRMHSDMRAGLPVGLELRRLSEMAIISGETRVKMQNLIKTGNAKKAFDLFMEDFKGSGIQDKMAKTFSGLVSNIHDALGKAARQIGGPVFDEAKKGLQSIYEFMSSPRWQTAVDNITDAFQSLMQGFQSMFGGVSFESFLDGVESVMFEAGVIMRNFSDVAALAVLDAINFANENFPDFAAGLDILLPKWAGIWAAAEAIFRGFVDNIKAMFQEIANVGEAFQAGVNKVDEKVREQGFLKTMANGLPELINPLFGLFGGGEDGKGKGMFDTFAEGFTEKFANQEQPKLGPNAYDAFSKAEEEMKKKLGLDEEGGGIKNKIKEAIDIINERMNKREEEAFDAREKRRKEREQPVDSPDKTEKWLNANKDKAKPEFESIEGLSKKIQTSLQRKDDPNFQTAKNTGMMVARLDTINRNVVEALTNPSAAVLS